MDSPLGQGTDGPSDNNGNKNRRPRLIKRFSKSQLTNSVLILLLLVIVSFAAWKIFAANDKPESIVDKAKNQTEQLVKLTRNLEKDSADSGLTQDIEELASQRKDTIKQLIASNPSEVKANHFPNELYEKLPQNAKNLVEHEVTLEGTLEVSIGEEVDESSGDMKNPFYVFDLKTADGKHKKLYFDGEGPNTKANDIVRLEGVELEEEVAVGSESAVTTTGEATVEAAATMRKVAVILVNFTNDTYNAKTPAEVATLLFGSTASVNKYYEESSYGTIGFTGDVFGWYTIPFDNTACNTSQWYTAAVQAAGITASNYNHVMLIFPNVASCGWAGLASVGGSSSWINNSLRIGTIAHELGHNLGFSHAGAVACTQNGVAVILSTTCTTYEYGDPFTVMGQSGNTRNLNHYQRRYKGWLSETVNITANGTYTIAPTELSGTPRLVRIARGDGTFLYLEYRQPYGEFGIPSTDKATQGVTIRLGPDVTVTGAKTNLLDMNPGGTSTSFTDASLLPGKSFTDPVSKVSITTTSVSASSAVINVSFNSATDTTPPTAPGNFAATIASSTSVNLSWTSSTDNVGVIGYRIKRDGVTISSTAGNTFTDTGLTVSTAYVFSVSAYDAAGNESTAVTANITTPVLDTTKPSLTITSPSGTVSGAAVIMSANATDNIGISRVDFVMDNVVINSDTTAPYSYTWNSTTVPNGSYTFAVRAYDLANNLYAASRTITVSNTTGGDATVPVVSITAPGSGSTVSGTVSIAATASDNIGVTKVEFMLGNIILGTDISSPYSFSWDSTTVANGSYEITAKGYDAAGNTGTNKITISVLNASMPAIPLPKIEAELGLLQGSASVVSDATASNGSAIHFTQTTSPTLGFLFLRYLIYF